MPVLLAPSCYLPQGSCWQRIVPPLPPIGFESHPERLLSGCRDGYLPMIVGVIFGSIAIGSFGCRKENLARDEHSHSQAIALKRRTSANSLVYCGAAAHSDKFNFSSLSSPVEARFRRRSLRSRLLEHRFGITSV